MRTIIGSLIILIGLIAIFFGNIFVIAWCIYDAFIMLETGVTFGSCLWLVLLWFCRGLITVFVGILMTGIGLAIADYD
jgi:hypothetical protein